MTKNGTNDSHPVKVVQLSSVHLPTDTRIFHRTATTLASEGYDVQYVVPAEKDELRNGVQISALNQPGSRFSRLLKTIPAAFLRALRTDADIYHLHDVELIPAGLLLRLLGKKVIYDAHENIRGEIRKKHWIPLPLRIPASLVAGIVEDLADPVWSAVIAATPGIEEKFRNRRVRVVQNFPEVDTFSTASGPDLRENRLKSKHFIFVGSLNELRGAREILKALDRSNIPDKVRLTILGSLSPPNLIEDLQSMSGWRSVDLIGWQPYEVVAREMSRALAGLLLFHPAPNHMRSQPRKLFEYMAAGLPVIASDFDSWRRIIGRIGCGILVDPTDPRAIADAMAELLDDPERAVEMGRRGAEAVRKRYNWRNEREKLLSLYEELSR